MSLKSVRLNADETFDVYVESGGSSRRRVLFEVNGGRAGAAGTTPGIGRPFGGAVGVADGAAAQPGLYFIANTNNGIYRAGANDWHLLANGVTRIRITDTIVVFNEDSAAVSFRVESDLDANAIFMDGTLNGIWFGGVPDANTKYNFTSATFTPTAGQNGLYMNIDPRISEAASLTHALLLGVNISALSVTAGPAAVTEAATLRVADAPAAVGATNMAFWVDNGMTRLDGTTRLNLVTYTWPGADGTSGQQLQTDGAGTLSWAAAGSRRSYKNILGKHDRQDGLDKILGTEVYDFKYRPSQRLWNSDSGETWVHYGTGDCETVYAGPVADEAPWVMHHQGGVFNEINAFGYSVLAIQALHEAIKELKRELALLRS